MSKEAAATRHRHSPDLAENATIVLAAMAEPNRLWLLRLLLDREQCVTACVEQTGLVQSLVSKHLARLIDAGLVQRRRDGRRNYYSVVNPSDVSALINAADALAHPQTHAPGAHR